MAGEDEVEEIIEEEVSLRDILEASTPEGENYASLDSKDTDSTGEEEPEGQGGTGDGATVDEASGDSGVQRVSKPALGKEKQPEVKEDADKAVPEASESEGQPADTLKAPSTWRPETREQWAKLPEQVRREVLKREHDMSRGMQESAQARQFSQEFEKAVAPYLAVIQSENSTPLVAMQNMFNTAYKLRTDTPANKATVVADIIDTYGIDIEALDQVLIKRRDGGAGPTPHANGQTAPDAGLQSWMQQQLAPVNQFINEVQSGRQQAAVQTQQEVQTTVQKFAADAKNEFYADVREDMADLMELAAKRGVSLDLPEAYRRATMARSDIAEVLAQRQVQKAAASASRNARSARSAAVSIEGTPPDSGSSHLNPGASVRDTLEHAWDSTQNDV